MDPIGFGLENFDLIGGWRDLDGRTPVDPSGQLVDGTKLNGPGDLRAALLSRSDAFVTTATGKLLTYALGRPIHADDMPTVRAIVAPRGSKQSSLLVSRPRRRRERAVSDETEETVGARQDMAFLTKKHLSRRTFLNGVGVTIALPFLESMVPAGTPLAQTAAHRPDAAGMHLRPARRDDGQVDAVGGREGLRADRNPPAARAVPRAR